MTQLNKTVFLTFSVLCFSACYSFKNTSIPIEWKTYHVENFENIADNVVPLMDINFTEKLKDKITTQTRLNYTDVDPSISLSGKITDFKVSAPSISGNEEVSFNRLDIVFRVKFISSVSEDQNWEKTFKWYEDFDKNANLLDVQDELIESITDKVVEDIFNEAFTNW